jgi:hypothetical protein
MINVGNNISETRTYTHTYLLGATQCTSCGWGFGSVCTSFHALACEGWVTLKLLLSRGNDMVT